MPCQRVELASAERRDVVTRVAAALRRGELCVLPTETVYGLAALPSSPAAVQRLRALKGRERDHHFTFHTADTAGAGRLANMDDPRARRLASRYWPGPLTLVLPALGTTGAAAGGAVGVRVPAHELTREILQELGEPLWLTSVNLTGDPPLCDATAVERQFGQSLAIVVDDGPSPLGTASTVARCTGPELEVLREGILSRDEVLQAASALVLFVCTGNTCRSPLAEALARRDVAARLELAPEALLARGLWFASAGTGSLDGYPASDNSVLVGAEVGVDLQPHRSRALTEELVARAAQLLCLSRSHLEAVVDTVPEAAAKTVMLRPDGRDIADPYGMEPDVYRRARDEIAAAVAARVDGWLQLLPAR